MEDVVNVGDQVTVRVREIDKRGRINLILRDVPQGDAPVPACSSQGCCDPGASSQREAGSLGPAFFMG